MSELEEKLNTILSDSNAMGQIMALANSLSSGQSPSNPIPPTVSNEPPSSTNLFSSAQLNSFDPRLLEILLSALSAYNTDHDSRANLLTALRPFIRKERYSKLDQAIQVSRITSALRAALDSFRSSRGGDKDV